MGYSNTLTLDIAPHGTFVATLLELHLASKLTRRKIVQLIIDGYGGGGGSRRDERSTKAYWKRFPTAVLQVMYCDMYSPKELLAMKRVPQPEASPAFD